MIAGNLVPGQQYQVSIQNMAIVPEDRISISISDGEGNAYVDMQVINARSTYYSDTFTANTKYLYASVVNYNGQWSSPPVDVQVISKQTGNLASKSTTRATTKPTVNLAAKPTTKPTTNPTVKPTIKPTVKPTVQPTVKPTVNLAPKTTPKPVAKPIAKPVAKPTVKSKAKSSSY
ncbi:hypothetical protein [uncultured Methanoregula sp.]|uniref:hypothetical protein n=1 Tax=uncultured Methanoregula sp. TaxID=1005933 RepID=UPI003748A993